MVKNITYNLVKLAFCLCISVVALLQLRIGTDVANMTTLLEKIEGFDFFNSYHLSLHSFKEKEESLFIFAHLLILLGASLLILGRNLGRKLVLVGILLRVLFFSKIVWENETERLESIQSTLLWLSLAGSSCCLKE